MLSIENLVVKYRTKEIVRGINFHVSKGEVVGLLGPNGAGKTTSFYAVVGLTPCSKGKILLDGEDIAKTPMHKRALKGISYLPQEPSVFRKLTVEENIMAILEHIEKDNTKAEIILEDLLEKLGISSVRTQKAFSLSGGERRRVEIARSLVLSPKFILLDEPFAGIDPLAVMDIQKLIQDLKSSGIGILITDHNVRETLAICDRAYILTDGAILESGTPSEIEASEKAKKYYLGEEFSL